MSKNRLGLILFSSYFVISMLLAMCPLHAEQVPDIKFDHIHTYAETVSYLNRVVEAYPKLTKIHTIGKSFLGKDLLVLEITNQETGKGLDKPAYWIDGCMHSSEVAGGEISLHTIHTLVTHYGRDPLVTSILDTKTFYIMPKLNPDGSDYAITKPGGMRSVVRPFDDDGDGLMDEDPAEDIDGDGNITMMRVRDPKGPMKTSPEDPRLMVSATQGTDPEGWQGEWRVLQEGIDNDNDGEFNEDGIGGIDINRNFPEQWQPSPISYNPGPYPLSEQESRAVADFLLTLNNLTGSINYHQTGNVAVFPPSNLRVNPMTGDKIRQPYEDEMMYKRLGRKCIELNDTVKVQVFKIHGASPATWHGSIWGVYVDWIYYRLGAYSWIFEFGISPGAKEIFPSRGRDIDRLRWSDENMDGKLFVDWKPFDHPTLGKVELGGFLWKIYDEKHKTYTNVQCLPGPGWEKVLDNHYKWHLFLVEQSPLVRITDVKIRPGESGYFTVKAAVENVGSLPTYVAKQALIGELARTVKATISLTNAELVSGGKTLDLGHLEGKSSRGGGQKAEVQWVVKASGGGKPAVIIKAISEKGGIDTKEIVLSK